MALTQTLLLLLLITLLILECVCAYKKKKPCRYNGQRYKAGEVITTMEDNCVRLICSTKGKKVELAIIEDCNYCKDDSFTTTELPTKEACDPYECVYNPFPTDVMIPGRCLRGDDHDEVNAGQQDCKGGCNCWIEAGARPTNLSIPEVPSLPDSSSSQVVVNYTAIQNGDYFSLVNLYAPVLRFDSEQGTEDYCFTSSASDYYNARKDGKTDEICNLDYNTMKTSGKVPTYWKAMECEDSLHIAYWFFYGYQAECAWPGWGTHDADWEHIILKVDNYTTTEHKLGRMQFYQHEGWYTRDPGHYQVLDDRPNPVVYIGKTSHGSYHIPGGWGGCLYWADWRNPGGVNKHVYTGENLVELKRGASSPAFMNDKDSQRYFDGIKSPLDRDTTDTMCKIFGCKGNWPGGFGTDGCLESQVDDDEYF